MKMPNYSHQSCHTALPHQSFSFHPSKRTSLRPLCHQFLLRLFRITFTLPSHGVGPNLVYLVPFRPVFVAFISRHRKSHHPRSPRLKLKPAISNRRLHVPRDGFPIMHVISTFFIWFICWAVDAQRKWAREK